MFNRCSTWQSMMTRQAVERLSPDERAQLDDHISKCTACRDASAADEVFESLLRAPAPQMASGGARAFDDAVVMALRTEPLLARPGAVWRERARMIWATLSLEFCMQLAGGALAAAAVTAFTIVWALNPLPNSRALSVHELRSMSAVVPNEPPVPLESLLQSPTPRAAMLWATPGRSPRRLPADRAPVSPRVHVPGSGHNSTAPRRHGEVTRGYSIA